MSWPSGAAKLERPGHQHWLWLKRKILVSVDQRLQLVHTVPEAHASSAINTNFSNFSGFMLYIFFLTHQTCEGKYTTEEEKRPTMIKVCLCAELLWSWSPWKGFLMCHPPVARRKIKVHPDVMPYVKD